ncbi:MAG: hypothetical protein ACKVOB_13490 [Sphingomonas sp.]
MTVAQRASAYRQIAAKGQTVTLTRNTSGTYDPATGAASITTTTQIGKGVILPLAAFAKAQGNVVEGDQQLLLGALDTAGSVLTAPVVDDSVTLADGSVVTITAIDPLEPAGLSIIYDCRVRGAA